MTIAHLSRGDKGLSLGELRSQYHSLVNDCENLILTPSWPKDTTDAELLEAGKGAIIQMYHLFTQRVKLDSQLLGCAHALMKPMQDANFANMPNSLLDNGGKKCLNLSIQVGEATQKFYESMQETYGVNWQPAFLEQMRRWTKDTTFQAAFDEKTLFSGWDRVSIQLPDGTATHRKHRCNVTLYPTDYNPFAGELRLAQKPTPETCSHEAIDLLF